MYFNLKYMETHNLVFMDIFILQIAKQQKSEDLTKYLEKEKLRVQELLAAKLLKKIKGHKKDPEMSKIRISKEGEEILSNIEIAEINGDDLTVFEWIKGVYLSREKVLGNQKKTKLYIALFRVHSGIDRNKLATLISAFLEDDRNMQYNNCMEYAFFKPQNAYNTKFNLEESRLYQYYLTHKVYFDEKFESL